MIDTEDLAVAVRDMFSPEAREEIGPLRIRKRRRVPHKPDARAAPAATVKG
jgi:hypothetical protein